MPPFNPTQALASAAALRNAPSRNNMDAYADIFAGPAEGHVPSAWEQATGDANADDAATALGAGPAIAALRHAADERRLQHTNDLLTADADQEAHGLDRAMLGANIENQVGDVLSEGAAGRQFMPKADALFQRNTGAQLALTDAHYGNPARIQAQGRVGAEGVRAQGHLDLESQKENFARIQALLDAYAKRYGGADPGSAMDSPDTLNQIGSIFKSAGR